MIAFKHMLLHMYCNRKWFPMANLFSSLTDDDSGNVCYLLIYVIFINVRYVSQVWLNVVAAKPLTRNFPHCPHVWPCEVDYCVGSSSFLAAHRSCFPPSTRLYIVSCKSFLLLPSSRLALQLWCVALHPLANEQHSTILHWRDQWILFE